MQTTEMNAQTTKAGKSRKVTTQPVASAKAIEPIVPAETPESEAVIPEASAPFDITAPEPTKSPAQRQAEPQVEMLDLNKIVNSTYNPRKDFNENTLLELADSIRQVGVLQPICVRPKGDGYEIVYGERRYWAAAMASLTHIPAIVRDMTDAEAEDAAITENLQREDVKPREEAAAYKRALESGRHTIESLVGKFGKSEGYIRSRLKLCELIDALAEQLDKEEISVGVATEIAKYDAAVQQEVYDEHFAEGCRLSWKNARIKEIAKRLYERYMTKLETYRFDKTECLSCHHNTANQVLFSDCTGGCAGCTNAACMIRKNEEFLMQKAIRLLKEDPRTMLSTAGDTPTAVLEALEEGGYHVEELEYSVRCYDEAPEMPTAPKAEEYDSEEVFTEAQEDYEAELAEFTEQTQQLEFNISEGRVRKYAVIGTLDVDFYYEEIEDEEREVEVEGEDGPRNIFVTVIPPSPMEGLLQQDLRNRQLCYEHITTDMKREFHEVKLSNKPLQKEETQMFYYAVMRDVSSDTRLKQCGFKPKEGSWMNSEEQFTAAGRITEKQRAALMRTYLLDFFRSHAPEFRCTDETLDTKLMCRFADLNFEEQSQAVQQKYMEVYEKRRARLQEQIDDLKAQEEAAAIVASMQGDPDLEPEEMPNEPEATPDDTPQRPQEPLTIPMDPDIEPDTRMPEGLKTAA